MMHAADSEEPDSIDATDEGLRRAAEEHAVADDDGEHDVCPVAWSYLGAGQSRWAHVAVPS